MSSYSFVVPSHSVKNKWGTQNQTDYSIKFTTGDKETLNLEFNKKSGIVDAGTNITITPSVSDAQIFYTTDNSDPKVSGILYRNGILIDKSVTIKAYATKDGYYDSDIIGATYIISNGDATTSTSYLSLSNVVIDKDNPNKSLSISLVNPDDNICFVMFDLYLPNRVSIADDNVTNSIIVSDRIPSGNRIIASRLQDDGSTRIIATTYTSENFSGTDGELFQIPLIVENGKYEDLIFTSNIELVSAVGKLITPSTNYSTIYVDTSAGIEDVKSDEKLIIDCHNGIIYLKAYNDTPVLVINTSGVVIRSLTLRQGESTSFHLPKGVYIINNKKIII